uniref:Tubulin-specific chaperone A n=1 Tax=Eutreptiella gymnastica TaxID=73025 RepID=A0A7S4GPU3_9EUGL
MNMGRFCCSKGFVLTTRTPFAYLGAQSCRSVRTFQSSCIQLQAKDWKKELDELGEAFAEARVEIEDARESAETVYFKDDYEAAAEMVADVQEMYSNLLETMPAEEAGRLKREQDPKMAQLAEEMQQLKELLH